MREIALEEISRAVESLCIISNCSLGEDVKKSLRESLERENSAVGREVLEEILENIRLAERESLPLCQDTGLVVVFVEIGQDVRIVGGNFYEAINKGVANGYRKGFLRKSVVKDPLRRENTQDNTPAWINVEIVSGDRLKISLMPKGAGSENMSVVEMLSPTVGKDGIEKFIVDWVRERGVNACPPLVVGVGIGGTFDGAAHLAKKSLLRPIGSKNPDPFYAEMEEELLLRINNLGLGPQGLGGTITALAVHIETYACHIASLPVAVNLQCHASRHRTIVI